MRFKHGLRYRVALAFALFGGLVSLLLAVGLYIASHDLEERLIDQTLNSEMQDYIARHERNPTSIPQATATIRSYVRGPGSVAASLPPALASLRPGTQHVELKDTPYRAIVADRGNLRYYVLFSEVMLQRRERSFMAFLATGVVVMSVLAAAVGLWLTGRVIAPVTQLAERVRGLNPELRTEPLASFYPVDEVGELAASFDHYLERLQDFIERERAFTGDVSHELRTPLAIIAGAAEVLLGDPSLADSVRERIERIARASGEMTELTSALLGLARETEGAMPPGGACSVEEVLRDVVDKLSVLLQQKPVTVELDIQARPQLQVEKAMLAIVLGNIVRNAFSFTERGSIRIQLAADSICVEDTGSGIRPEEIKRVFQRYYRGSGSAGAGIGLSLVKRICDRYRWNVSLTSTEGSGTLIRLDFTPLVSNHNQDILPVSLDD